MHDQQYIKICTLLCFEGNLKKISPLLAISSFYVYSESRSLFWDKQRPREYFVGRMYIFLKRVRKICEKRLLAS